ncbi:MAG: precorrin-6Y C5,15-methyltransferase (decarboxylating) subunit CbiT [Propionibacteriaceae bacterium]|nr:precorrin-6Y C5,15-methyltransferase (decarboxylating) subunit CbiT [Propionibacteriaceae bacterium]
MTSPSSWSLSGSHPRHEDRDPTKGRQASPLARTPGLPDDAFEHDGLITKRHLRASALAHLAPLPGELLWDLGAGAGSVGIEWCRAADGCRTIAVERIDHRADRAEANAARLAPAGSFELRRAAVEDVLAELPDPDAVFIGGGASMRVVEHAVGRLPEGGRIVVHGVTVETEELCVAAYRRWGGALSRIAVENAEPIGRLLGWTPARTVVAWSHVVGR